MSQNVTVIGNLASDPELRFTPQGKAVCNFVVITSKSKKDEQTGKWESYDQTAWRVTAWEKLGENCMETLAKGFPVLVFGNAVLRKWESSDGKQGVNLEVNAFHVGLDLKRFPAKASVIERRDAVAQADGDPWSGSDSWATPRQDDIPPF